MPVLMFYNCCLLLWCCGATGASSGSGGGRCRRPEQSDRCACGRCRCGAKKMTNEDINAKQPLRVKSVKLMVVAIVQSWIMQSFCISQNMQILTSQENSNYNFYTFQLVTICWGTARLVHRSGTTHRVKMYRYKYYTNRYMLTYRIQIDFSIHIESVGSPSDKAAALASSLAWQTPTSPHAKTAEIVWWHPANHEDRKLAVNPWRKCKNLGVSKNRGEPPKWMVKIMENPIKVDDLGGKPTIFGNIHMQLNIN